MTSLIFRGEWNPSTLYDNAVSDVEDGFLDEVMYEGALFIGNFYNIDANPMDYSEPRFQTTPTAGNPSTSEPGFVWDLAPGQVVNFNTAVPSWPTQTIQEDPNQSTTTVNHTLVNVPILKTGYVSSSAVALFWQPAEVAGVGDVSSYDVYAKNNTTGVNSLAGTTTGTSFTVSGLSASTGYTFLIDANDETGTSGPNSQFSTGGSYVWQENPDAGPNPTITVSTDAASPSSGKYFSPYVDMTLGSTDLQTISANSGLRSFTLAFMQTTEDSSGGVVLTNGAPSISWGGLGTRTTESTGTIMQEVRAVEAEGGTVTISIGGYLGLDAAVYAAQQGLSAAQLASEYQSVVTTYGVNSLDFDIENAATVNNTAANHLRDEAILILEAQDPGLQVSFTMATNANGLNSTSGNGNDLAVLSLAVTDHVAINVVNIMAMDYDDSNSADAPPPNGVGTNGMATSAITAAQAVETQLVNLGIAGTTKIGITPMIGQNDDYGQSPALFGDNVDEVFTLADAQAVEAFAASTPYIAGMGEWQLPRDSNETSNVLAVSPDPNSSGLIQTAYEFADDLSAIQEGQSLVTIAVPSASGIDLSWATLYDELANSPIAAPSFATQYSAVDNASFDGHSAAVKFLVSGTGLTYSGSSPNTQLTGGTITGIQVENTSGTVLASYTGLSVSAATYQAAMSSYTSGGSANATALNAIFLASVYSATGGAGADKLQGGNFNDTFFASTGNDAINGGSGTNTVNYSSLVTPGMVAVIQGGGGTLNKGGANGVDTLTGIQNLIDNGSGRANGDVFEVDSAENITANSSNFNYLIELTPTVNLAYGTNFTGITEFVSNTGTNTVNFATDTNFAYLYGSTGNDTLTLGSGGGYMYGEGGTNTLTGGVNATNLFEGGSGGTDTMNGGGGTASNFYYADSNDQINGAGAFNTMVELATGVAVQIGSAKYQDVQEFVADAGNNTVTVSNTDSGFSYLYGGAGNDTMSTGSGGGYLIGEGGTNTLNGGGGSNVFVADGASGIDTMNGGTGSNVYLIDSHSTVRGAGTFNTVEELQQSVTLTLGSTQLGTDVQEVELNGGNNTVDFHSASTAVFLYGAAGNDTLFGGTGNDFLYGGAGANTFEFQAGWGKDTIGDWTSGSGNLMDLTALASSGVHAVTDLTQTITGGNDVITSSHTGTNSITLMGVSSTLAAGSFHFA